ncbi:MATE family multidrug resistance protein [Cereibacter johrii]|uniref:MATE family multidrug resistance protein n=1 Tax=Cereibacter johrii TaxID=445629 RepID=A0ABX5JFS6_9RHOB|nr:MATE family efflux transporter [Cereibacter johrii]PTM81581.1 MATE family multidrug resistance protein [Cereibacter johrii]
MSDRPAVAPPELTHARILRMALPIVISNATVPLLGAVDTGVVGQLGQAAPIGAVGLGAVVLATLYWIFSFLRMGTSGLAAQAHGAGDEAERSAILLRSLLIGLGAGLCFILLQLPVIWATFRVAPASAEVEALTRTYLSIRIWGAPATIGLYAVTGWLVALERTRGILVLQLWMNGLNIGLDLLFVLGLGYGVGGVAVATLIAEWTGLALGLWLCRDAFGPVLAAARARLADAEAIRRMLGVNRDIMIRSVLLQGSFTAFVFLGAGFGDVTLAANQVLLQFLEVSAYALDGFAFAAEALVGQAVGARSVGRVRRASIMLGQWGAGGAALIALGIALFGPAVIDLISTAPEVRAEARAYLPWLVAAPLIGVASWIFDGIFIGATRTREMMQAIMVSVTLYGLALLLFVPLLGNHGLWAALAVLNAARGVTMALLYPRVERSAAPA